MKNILITVLFLTISISSYGQQNLASWEYQPYPDLPFILDHMELDLTIDTDSPMISGKGVYELTSRRPGLTEIVFNTSDLEIQAVTVNNQETAYRVSSDSLLIRLPDSLQAGEQTVMGITWESTSPYGLNKDVYGNMWTSLNPEARHHWMPIPDHPEVSSTVTASAVIPADHELIMNGSKTADEVISAEEKRVEWTANTPVSVTGLTLVVGTFETVTARSGIKEISVSASEEVLLPEVRDGLLSIAVSTLKDHEQKLSFEFPYESLNVVVLPDHHWEEIQAGAGVIYLYQDLGPLGTQLKRGIAEQWFGNYHRYLDAPNNKYEFLKVLMSGSDGTEQLKNPDELQSIFRWNLWQKGVDDIEDTFLKEQISTSLPELIKDFEGVTGWHDYADFWYDETGIYWQDLPTVKLMEEEPTDEENFEYNVEYLYDEMNGSLTLVFEAVQDPVETLVGVEVTEFGFVDTVRSEIAFTGMTDTVSVNISTGADYVTLTAKSERPVTLNENKPAMFWIQQLRSTEPDNQIQAAHALKGFTENPDLQLALQDVLREENNADVRAAILETLSLITKDASGTEETFLSNLNSEDQAIKISGLKALANYDENEQVAHSVRNTLLQAEADTVFNVALNTYRQISGAGELTSLANRLGQDMDQLDRSVKVLKLAVPIDTSRQALSIADRYALGEYPYTIKKAGLELLIDHEENESYWSQTLELLLENRDPRIRFKALDGVRFLPEGERRSLLESRMKEEQDPRIRTKITRLLN